MQFSKLMLPVVISTSNATSFLKINNTTKNLKH